MMQTTCITQPHIQNKLQFFRTPPQRSSSAAALAAFDVFKADGRCRQARKVLFSVAIRAKKDTLSDFRLNLGMAPIRQRAHVEIE
ncbi:MAG: hypothetical protein ACREPQ_08780 [Rhodanobacter sp.]